jgi:cell pole-organizing protein PopZ
MSDSAQEPTMEEILASIRRIISEDDAPESTAEAAPAATVEPAVEEEPEAAEEEPVAAAAPPPAPKPEPEAAEEEEDALELTDKVETHGDLEVMTAPPPEPPAPVAAPAPAPAPKPVAEGLVSAPAAAAAAAAFGRLTSATLMPPAGRTLEDVVSELLRPMLQQWLDENLPEIVQTAVDAEVARISRGN